MSEQQEEILSEIAVEPTVEESQTTESYETETISIVIPKANFSPGEQLSGHVLCKIEQPITLGLLTIVFSGVEHIHYRQVDKQQDFFKKTVRLEIEREQQDSIEEAPQDLTLQKGIHKMPFTLDIPDNLPFSMSLGIADVSYSLVASLWYESYADNIEPSEPPALKSYKEINLELNKLETSFTECMDLENQVSQTFSLESGPLAVTCFLGSEISNGEIARVPVEIVDRSSAQIKKIVASFVEQVEIYLDESSSFEEEHHFSEIDVDGDKIIKNATFKHTFSLDPPQTTLQNPNSLLKLCSVNYHICVKIVLDDEDNTELKVKLPVTMAHSQIVRVFDENFDLDPSDISNIVEPPQESEEQREEDGEEREEEGEAQDEDQDTPIDESTSEKEVEDIVVAEEQNESLQSEEQLNGHINESNQLTNISLTEIVSSYEGIDHYHLMKDYVIDPANGERSSPTRPQAQSPNSKKGNQSMMTPSSSALPNLRRAQNEYFSPVSKEYRVLEEAADLNVEQKCMMLSIKNQVEETRRTIRMYSDIIHQYDNLKPGQSLSSISSLPPKTSPNKHSPTKSQRTQPFHSTQKSVREEASQYEDNNASNSFDQNVQNISSIPTQTDNHEESFEYVMVERRTEKVSQSPAKKDFEQPIEPQLGDNTGPEYISLSVGVYKGEHIDEIPHGRGEMRYKNGSVYEGEWSNGKKHGKGKLVYSDGAIYEGQWVKDKRHGWGFYSTATYKYDGQWEGDQKQGRGVIVYNNEEQYDGEWDANYPEGTGTYIFQDGSVYKGEFKKGLRVGKGTLTYANGVVYEGDFVNDRKSGQATITFQNGIYVGAMQDDVRHGYGVYRYSNGDVYEGEWVNNKKEGAGVMNYASGGWFKGHWLNGSKYGRGELVASDGSRFFEVWENGSLIDKLRL